MARLPISDRNIVYPVMFALYLRVERGFGHLQKRRQYRRELVSQYSFRVPKPTKPGKDKLVMAARSGSPLCPVSAVENWMRHSSRVQPMFPQLFCPGKAYVSGSGSKRVRTGM